ncbi:hypothetical protein SCBWM1_gp7 [Synechococcus phage S-CBWM1]|uniref:Uncharacterized protein n=1 Tax=Synechococcus phage S-CBWM1 TaxID=2053653 RepID=A0A3G1L311_9CAUD|nr:hypothetical protein HOU61_gp008 [Synechococcus phage S-CBWM1]ATW62691.1 hypothetical protein SCBWM1_gp7 [Synechococcus phage S-CBWM1]
MKILCQPKPAEPLSAFLFSGAIRESDVYEFEEWLSKIDLGGGKWNGLSTYVEPYLEVGEPYLRLVASCYWGVLTVTRIFWVYPDTVIVQDSGDPEFPIKDYRKGFFEKRFYRV